jgi:hypothetical protein
MAEDKNAIMANGISVRDDVGGSEKLERYDAIQI